MDFGNFREKSVKIGTYRKLSKRFRILSEKRRVHSVSGRHMKTGNGIHPTFTERRSNMFIISDLYRVITELAEFHTDKTRSFLSPLGLTLIPSYPSSQ